MHVWRGACITNGDSVTVLLSEDLALMQKEWGILMFAFCAKVGEYWSQGVKNGLW